MSKKLAITLLGVLVVGFAIQFLVIKLQRITINGLKKELQTNEKLFNQMESMNKSCIDSINALKEENRS